MLSEHTAAKIDAALKLIKDAQDAGEGPMPGQWSREALAKAAGISETPIRDIEMTFRARLIVKLLKDPATQKLGQKLMSRHLPEA